MVVCLHLRALLAVCLHYRAVGRSFGHVDSDIVWRPQNVSVDMMECPDLFPLGDKFVLLGSLFQTNQWWVGSLADNPPRFTPEAVGILDYGNFYAAKTGSSMVQTGDSRRVVFAFTGWSEPTMPRGCGRNLVFPRELRLEGSRLVVEPVHELAALRKPGSRTTVAIGNGLRASASATQLASGAQVEARLVCDLGKAAPTNGTVGIRALGGSNGSSYTEVGYDFGNSTFYVDHTRCCAAASPIVQRAPLPAAILGGRLELVALVDGGIIEAFLAGVAITALVSPDLAAGAPQIRSTSAFATLGGHAVDCSATSWELTYNATDPFVWRVA